MNGYDYETHKMLKEAGASDADIEAAAIFDVSPWDTLDTAKAAIAANPGCTSFRIEREYWDGNYSEEEAKGSTPEEVTADSIRGLSAALMCIPGTIRIRVTGPATDIGKD